jgi:hypothetical protein
MYSCKVVLPADDRQWVFAYSVEVQPHLYVVPFPGGIMKTIIHKILLIAMLVTAFQVAFQPSKLNLELMAGGTTKGGDVPVTTG